MSLNELSIGGFHQALQKGCLSCLELVDFYLDRIARGDELLRSVICINPNARAQAQACDDFFAKEGRLHGSLFGVPVLLKDNVETADLPTTAGSLSLASFNSGEDAFIVQQLRAAGAIILAKMNLHEFAIWGETISSVRGQTLNPYDLSRTPGGSSGGTGAGLAANFGLVGIGTDTVNSVRSPSASNSLFGLRPSYGQLSRSGIVPYSLTQDTAGPMARTARDLRQVFNVIKGYDAQDSSTAWGYHRSTTGLDRLKGLRIGVLRSFYGHEDVNREVNRAMNEAEAHWRALGIELVDVQDELDSASLVHDTSVHLYELNADLSAYLQVKQAPVDSLAEILAGGLYHPGIEENIRQALKVSVDSEDYLRRRLRMQALRERMIAIFARYRISALLYPHQQQLVCKVGAGQQQRNGVLAAITGFPSLCMPAGFSTPDMDAPLGVPIGMELLGLPFEDELLLDLAESFEAEYPLRIAPREQGWLR